MRHLRRWLMLAVLLTALVGPGHTQTAAPANYASQPALVIQGGDIYPIRGPIIRGGTVVVEDGKIKALGPRVDIPEGAKVIDATGKVVMPGLVASRLNDLVAGSAKKITDALDPYSPVVTFALASGITSAYVQGGTPNEAGLSAVNAVVKMTEGDLKGMLVREPVAINLVYAGRSAQQRSQLRLTLNQASTYLRRKAEYDRDKAAGKKGDEPKPPAGTDEALRLLRGELPARVFTASANDILGVLDLANEFNFKLILEGLVEGWTVAPQIAHSGAEAIVSPRVRIAPDRTLNTPTGASDTQTAVLTRAGIRVSIVPRAAGFDTSGTFGEDLFTLPLDAAYAVGGGLDEQIALEALTINPAAMLGVSDRIGSLQIGKDADIIILDGHPLHYRTFVETTIVNGKVLYERSKSTFFSHVGTPTNSASAPLPTP